MLGANCRCCCPPNELAPCGGVGDRFPRAAPAPDFNELLWSLSAESVIATELVTSGCTVSGDSFAVAETQSLCSLEIDVTDPAVDWYAIQHIWPEDVSIDQLGWLREITDSASYAKPSARWQAKRGGSDSFAQWGPSSPMVGIGLVLRQTGQPDAYTLPVWVRDATSPLVPLTLPKCWTTFSIDRPVLVRLDPAANADNRLDQWPFNDTRSRFDVPLNQWVFGTNPPFADWPPSRGDWQLGLYVIVCSRPETYIDSTGTTITRGEEFVRRLDPSFSLKLAIRSTCLYAAVVPACQAWFAELDDLTLAVPDTATVDGPGYGPIEPLQWRGLACTLSLADIEIDESLYLDARWRLALVYGRAFVGEITDQEHTLGHRVQFVFVPCVGIAIVVTPLNSCEFGILIQPAFDGPQTLNNGGRLADTYDGPPPPDEQTAPDWYPETSCDVTVYEPETTPLSYDPIALAYRYRVLNYPRPGAIGNCETEPCEPYDSGWDCALTLLRRLSFSAQYESASIAGATQPCAYWLWLEIHSPA